MRTKRDQSVLENTAVLHYSAMETDAEAGVAGRAFDDGSHPAAEAMSILGFGGLSRSCYVAGERLAGRRLA